MVYKCEMDVHYTGYCAAMSEIIYSKPLHHSFHTSPAIKFHQDSWVTGLHDIPSSASAWFLLGSNNFPHAECGPLLPDLQSAGSDSPHCVWLHWAAVVHTDMQPSRQIA